jgi:RNA polymerase-interacting CarD/CdnL/TRCF family regulator
MTKTADKWSADVTEHSNAMDLEKDIFKSGDPDKIAESVKHSAETSKRRKSSPYRSAMSMITFYENRAGKNLSSDEKQTLEKAKERLRELFGKDEK